MSNMRVKRSAHERMNTLISSGEWSSGQKWADDAPKEELDAEQVNNQQINKLILIISDRLILYRLDRVEHLFMVWRTSVSQ